MQALVRAGVAALAYFASARLGYAFAIPHAFVTLWPPSGVMLGLLAVSDKRHWPAFLAGGLAGSFASDLLTGFPIGMAMAAALANGSENLLAAWFVTWRLGSPVTPSSLRAVVVFTAGAGLLTNSLSAWLGALALHIGSGAPLARSWLAWGGGGGPGMMVVGAGLFGGAGCPAPASSAQAPRSHRSRWVSRRAGRSRRGRPRTAARLAGGPGTLSGFSVALLGRLEIWTGGGRQRLADRRRRRHLERRPGRVPLCHHHIVGRECGAAAVCFSQRRERLVADRVRRPPGTRRGRTTPDGERGALPGSL